MATETALRSLPIGKLTRETRDTMTLRLDGDEVFAPGQFNMLYVYGIGEVAISLSGDPARTGEIVHTIRAVGSVTNPLCALRRGARLGVRGPFGRGWPLDQAEGRDVLVIAGGLGLAPLRPAIYHLLGHRDRYRRVTLLIGARTPEDLLYRGETARWSRGAEVLVTVDRAGPSWRGEVGVVPALLERVPVEPQATVAFICGPEVMMRFTVRDLMHRGVLASAIYVSMERNMKCGIGLCGHCQYGPLFICKDGPVFSYDRVAPFFDRREI